jgi:fluoride exporter
MTALDVLWVGLGGGLGSLLRWWVGRAVGERWRGDFPLGTFLINISGAFPMGCLPVLFAVDWYTRHGAALTAPLPDRYNRRLHDLQQYADVDAFRPAGTSGHVRAASYLGLSVVAGLLAAALGAALARVQG